MVKTNDGWKVICKTCKHTILEHHPHPSYKGEIYCSGAVITNQPCDCKNFVAETFIDDNISSH